METIMERQDYRPRVRLEGVRYPDRTALERYVTSGVLPEHTLAGALRESFERNAQRKALLSPEGDVTYRRLDELTDRFGAALLKLGVRPLDRVVMQCCRHFDAMRFRISPTLPRQASTSCRVTIPGSTT
jgi:non-ribosomal peptide synthetase component E (peptide arylation enzyme)